MTLQTPPPDPNLGRAIRVVMDEHQRQRLGGAGDVTLVIGWIWRIVAWPPRAVLRLIRRTHNDEDRY